MEILKKIAFLLSCSHQDHDMDGVASVCEMLDVLAVNPNDETIAERVERNFNDAIQYPEYQDLWSA